MNRRALAIAFTISSSAIATPLACERHADIRDERQGSFTPPPKVDAGEIPELDAGLTSDAFPPCEERPTGGCAGPIDFPCAFAQWVEATAQTCQEQTGCITSGWLEVHMAEDGCVADIGMEQPNQPIVDCLLEAFGAVSCPCTAEETSYFFGNNNTGPCP